MKSKFFVALFFTLVLAVSLVVAENEDLADKAKALKAGAIDAVGEAKQLMEGSGNLTQDRAREMIKVRAGNYESMNGERIQVMQESNNQYRLSVGDRSAMVRFNLEQSGEGNKTKFHAKLSNGRNAEIKVMPNTASERALERLRLKNCAGNCTIELKEVGKGNQTKAAYSVKTERQSRFLGLFKTRMNVEAEVDAESGEVIRVNKPWWAFLASEPDETEE